MRTIIRKSFKAALDEHDILISPAAPSAAYKIGMLTSDNTLLLVEVAYFSQFSVKHILVIFPGEKKNDPLAMYAGDIMTVSL